MILGVSTGVAIAYVVALALLLLMPAVITWLKGRPGFVLAGLLVGGIVWMITMWRLAKPNSWWARRFYGPRKLEAARARYGG